MMAVFFVKSSLILLVALGATALMRRSSAASRHVVLSTAMLAVLLLPLTSALVPVLAIPILRPTIATPPADAALDLRPQAVAFAPSIIRPAETSAPATPPIATAVPWSALLWLAGSSVLLFRFARGYYMRQRLIWASAACADSRIINTTKALGHRLGIRRPISVWIAPNDMMPATWGVLRPSLLLPPSALAWTDERLTLVLTHELAHVQRFDAVAHGVTQLARAFTWWNPLVWLAASQAQLERERACDDVVLRAGVSASTYADDLLAIAQTLPSPFSQQLALAMARPHRIDRRLSAILDSGLRRTGTSHLCAMATSILLAAQLPLAAARLESPQLILPDTPLGIEVFAAFPLPVPEYSGALERVMTPSTQGAVTASPPARTARTVAPPSQTPTPPAIPPTPTGTFGAGAYRPGNGVTNPIRLREVKPLYTPAAERAGIQGIVELEAVVGASGAVTDVRILRSLDATLGLDANAMESVRNTPFVPCKAKDEPVPCLVVFELQYTLDAPAPIPAGQFGAGAYRFRQNAGMAEPKRLRGVAARYTPEAMRAKIEGAVELEFVVLADGTVGDVRVTKSLDTTFGLDEQAIKAIRATPFVPGSLNGVAVPFVMTSVHQFTLR